MYTVYTVYKIVHNIQKVYKMYKIYTKFTQYTKNIHNVNTKSLGPADGRPSSRFRQRCCLSWIRCRVIDQSTQPPLPVSVHGGYTKCMHTCMPRTHICVCTGQTHIYAQNTQTCMQRTHTYTCIHRTHTCTHFCADIMKERETEVLPGY